jgi:hypothetical protein
MLHKVLLDEVRLDLSRERKNAITRSFGMYLTAIEAELMGREGRYVASTFWDACAKRADDFAEIADIATRLLVCTTSEAEPERVFSVERRILNRHRGRLHINTLFYLTQIYLAGLAKEEKKNRFK